MVATPISIVGYGAGPATASPVWIASRGHAPPAAITATEVHVVGYRGLPASATPVRIAAYGKAPPGGATAIWISGGG